MQRVSIVVVGVVLVILGVFSRQKNNNLRKQIFESNIQIDKGIQPYFDHLVKGLQMEKVDIDLNQPISIRFTTELPEGVLGQARGMFDSSRVDIIINLAQWQQLNSAEKYWVLMHEMGHDFWGKFHDGHGLMRPYHKYGESKESLIAAVECFVEELKEA